MMASIERCPSLTVISSVPEKSVRCREVSAIKDACYKEVSLYLLKIYQLKFCRLAKIVRVVMLR